MHKMKSGLRAEHVIFGYEPGVDVIKDVSFSIAPGKITALIGANGCGKSTLFQLFTGRFHPASGDVFLENTNLKMMKQKEFARKVAVVHQYNTAPDDITVRKLVEMGRTPYQSFFAYSLSKRDQEAVDKALDITNTKEFENRMVSQLSGGQKQRVWMALALAQEPEILLLDEVTTYLDIRYQIELLSLIRKLNQEQGITVLMVLHDINQAMEYVDEIVVMKEGKIIAGGEIDEVITEEILEQAFHVNADIVEAQGKKYCLFSGKKQNDF